MNSPQERLAELDRLILAAHAAGAKAALAQLYAEAGDLLENVSTTDHAAFVRTQAYVYALETGDRVMASRLLITLRAAGRDT